MPIVRYFVFVGTLLLALLFAADRYLPAPVEHAAAADPDRTIIRIASARNLPEKIIFDTRPRAGVPMIVEAHPASEGMYSTREAMAAMPAAPTVESKKDPPTRVSAASRQHQKRSVKPSKRAAERLLAFRHNPESLKQVGREALHDTPTLWR